MTAAQQLFERTCRTCLSTDGEMVPIFSSGPHVKNLPMKIMAFTKVEIAEYDGLPDIICKKCIFLADSLYCFKEQCESADNRLKLMIEVRVRERCSLQRREKLDSESSYKTSKTAISITTSNSPKNNSSAGSQTSEILRDCSVSRNNHDSEEEYVVEYISDEVRKEVENAMKRKREAERRVGIEKLSESIKNLKGIEVVPISNDKTAQNFKPIDMKTQEIVVFPVRQHERMGSNRFEGKSFLNPQMIQTECLDDFLEHRKRPKLSSKSATENDPERSLINETPMIYGRNKKLHFSTVRKIVKIDDEALFVNPKENTIEYPKAECFQIDNQVQEIVQIGGDLESNNEDLKVTVRHENEPHIFYHQEGSEEYANAQRQEYGMQSNYKQTGECQTVQGSETFLEFQKEARVWSNSEKNIRLAEQKILNQREHGNSNDVIIIDSEEETGKEKFYFHPDMAVEDMEVLAQEFQQIQSKRVSESLPNDSVGSELTVDCIIKSCNESNVDHNIAKDFDLAITNPETVENSAESSTMYTTDKSNEVFIQNEIPEDAGDNVTHGDGSTTETHSNVSLINKHEVQTADENMELEAAESQRTTIIQKETQNSVSITGLQALDNVTPLALVKVHLSDEKDQKPILNIYQRETTTEEDQKLSVAETEQLIQNSNESNSGQSLKFYQCTVCKANFATMPTVLKHNIQKHMTDEKPFPCLICDKIFEDKPLLMLHVDEHNGLRPYRCTFCPKTFTLKRNLKRHVNHHIIYKPFHCSICMRRFTENSSLRSHMYLHTGDSPFTCKSCNVSFNNKANWKRHIMTIHEKLTVVHCKHCSKEFPDKRSLQIHTRTHTGDRPYKCPHCEKRFTQQCNLNTHIHCHLNDRPFLCSYCGKGFNQRGTRDDHVLTHTGEKPHRCSECSATFTVSSALKRHMWIHTDKDRPYNCKKCNMQFVGLYDLRRHLKVRHGEIVRPGNPRVERVTLLKSVKEEEDNRNLTDRSVESLENVAKIELGGDGIVEEKECEERCVSSVMVDSEIFGDEVVLEKQEGENLEPEKDF